MGFFLTGFAFWTAAGWPSYVLYMGRIGKVLTDAGSVPAVVALGTVRNAVIAQQPGPRSFTPQTNAADARLEVCRAALTVRAALCRKDAHREEYIIRLHTDKHRESNKDTIGNMQLLLLYFACLRCLTFFVKFVCLYYINKKTNLKGHYIVLERIFKLRILFFTTWMRWWHKLWNICLLHDWINKLFSEENKVPRTLFEARKEAGSATNKQIITVWNCAAL